MTTHFGLLTSCVRLGFSCASAREQDLLELRAANFVGAEEPSQDESQDERYQGGHVGKTDLTGMNRGDDEGVTGPAEPASCVVVSILQLYHPTLFGWRPFATFCRRGGAVFNLTLFAF